MNIKQLEVIAQVAKNGSLSKAASALGDFAVKANNLLSVDVNPILVMTKGRGVLAVDAVVQLN